MGTTDLVLLVVLVILIFLYFTTKSKERTPEQIAEIEQQGGDISETEQLISFLIPLVGFIIYGVNSSQRPYKAKKALTAAAWGIGLGVILMFCINMIMLGKR
jgi:hypothetical protein